MPVLKKKLTGDEENEWYLHISNRSGGMPPVYTIQIRDEGRDLLLSLDLDHAPKPNRQSDIDWDLFYTLDTLGLLYTKNTDYEPGDILPEKSSFKQLDGLSAEQRAEFALSLIERYELQDLCSREHAVTFLLSLETLPESQRQTVMDALLTDTPFTATLVDDYEAIFEKYGHSNITMKPEEYNPLFLSILLAFISIAWSGAKVYNSFIDLNEGSPLWMTEDWVSFSGEELMFYELNDTVYATLPEPVRDATFDQIAFPSGNGIFDFLSYEYSAFAFTLTIRAIDEASRGLRRLIEQGYPAKYSECTAILPRPATHTEDPPRAVFKEATTDAMVTSLFANNR